MKTIKSILIIAQIKIPKLYAHMKNQLKKQNYELMKICFNYGHSIVPLVRYSFWEKNFPWIFVISCYATYKVTTHNLEWNSMHKSFKFLPFQVTSPSPLLNKFFKLLIYNPLPIDKLITFIACYRCPSKKYLTKMDIAAPNTQATI